MGVEDTAEQVNRLIDIGETMARKYWVTCTNPPYAGTSNLSANVNNFVKKSYPDSKADLFAVFIERCHQMTSVNGFQAMITQHSWMFLSSFEKLREKMMLTETVNMAHLGARAFEEIGGEVVQTTAFVRCANHVEGYKGTYCRLIEPTSQQGKADMFISGQNQYHVGQISFSKIPGVPVAYWISPEVLKLFDERTVGSIADAKSGMTTTDNTRFLRLWEEVNCQKIGFGYSNIADTQDMKYKWFPFCKGGDFRRWAGNESFVVNWFNNGEEIRVAAEGATGGRLVNIDCALRECLVWTKISSANISLRLKKQGIFFSDAAPGVFTNRETLYYLLALLNTKYANEIIKLINPTLNFVPGAVSSVPVKKDEKNKGKIIEIAEGNVQLSERDWDSFETSWNFKKHPLLRNVSTLSEAFTQWQTECDDRFNRLKANEEELNRIFIDIYGLQDELTPEVEDKDVTVRKADLQRDIKSLLSYAVGCMFGRYSTYKDGLLFAGEPYSLQAFVDKYFRLGKNLNQRDTIAVRKIVGGYVKLLYPDGEFTKEQIEEILVFALEMRRRVKEQLKKLGGMEFYDVNFSYIDLDTFEEKFVSVPEQGGGKLIPDGICNPGQVYTVSQGKSGMIGVFRLESQMLPGNGKFERTGLGSDRDCKESTNTAFNFLKANGNRISGSISTTMRDYIINYQDLQGIGMTGKLALPTLIALCSIALGRPTVSTLAVLGEISISGTILKVDELANSLQVCLDSGAKKVLLPITSAADLGTVPPELVGSFNLIFYSSAEDAVFKALGVE